MAFRFAFAADDIEEHEASSEEQEGTPGDSSMTESPFSADPAQSDCMEVSLDELIEALPPVISHTPIRVPATRADKTEVILPRRDLFDVRFQLLNNDDEDEKNEPPAQQELDFIDAPSDLIPGVYEGGLKSWECSVDLAAYLADTVPRDKIRGSRILEIGCGTAIPSLCLLREAFNLGAAQSSEQATIFYLQDYNRSALEFMTLPNVILTWYLSPARGLRESSVAQESSEGGTTRDDGRSDLEVELTPELLSDFKSSLASLRITLRFFHGSWANLATSFDTLMKQPLVLDRNINADPSRPAHQERPVFDIVLTSETIYRPQSLASLLSLLYQASSSHSTEAGALCLVAAKVVYFGVGGGVNEFLRALEEGGDGWSQGHAETAWQEDRGVARRIMRLDWHTNS